MAKIKLDFDGFIILWNRVKMQTFYIETPTEFTIFIALEGQIFYTTVTIVEIRERFGDSEFVMDFFKKTYLLEAIRVETLETGATEITKDIEKLTTTETGGQGTPGYALIPVRMGSGKPRRCMSCGNIILSGETVCPACGSHEIDDKEAELDMKKWVGWDFEGTVKWMLEFLKTYDFAQITTLNKKQKKSIKQMLIDSITEGWNMNKLESEIETVTEDKNRARMIARSEIIRTANEGSILHYKEKGIEKVKWISVPSAPNGRTCPRCLELNGKEFLIKDAGGRIPLHPYCRCTWSPIVE